MKFTINKKIYKGIMLCLIIVFAVSVGKLIYQSYEARQGMEIYEEIEKYAELDSGAEEAGITETQQNEEKKLLTADFNELLKLNSDTTAWICLPGTKINYPVAKGNDNDYYLKHAFTGEANSAGSIFMDCRNSGDFSDKNNIIYGHYMKNGTMFSALNLYKDQKNYEKYPYIFITTPEKKYCIEIFSSYVADISENAWQIKFEDGEYEEWLKAAKEKSLVDSPVMPETTDITVTLSTCSYEFENARLVVAGILREVNN